mmetsp:Transcript_33745/g.38860  ORF Transcript_33745/g.38860 Transcript_33745/m.38860 type:complete len:118 (+) Transcript_33745:148-501(+)
MFVVIYSGFQLQTMFKRERTTVNLKSVYQDLTKEFKNVTMENYNFDFAFQLSINGIPAYDETVYSYKVYNVESWWAPDSNGIIRRFKINNDLKMGPCTKFLGNQVDVERLGINQSFY